MKRVSLWSSIEIEFNKEFQISELIDKYTLYYNGKDIDKEYFIIAQPLILDNDLTKRIIGEMENFANKRPIAFRWNENSANMTITEYQKSTINSFINYSNDIGMNISVMREIHFIKLFHLCFLCLAGNKTDSEKFINKLKRAFNKLIKYFAKESNI